MLRLKQVTEAHTKLLEEYKNYYTESIITSDRKIKNSMKKKCDECIPLIKYYEGERNAFEKTVSFLENAVQSFTESVEYMGEISKEKEYINKHYGSKRVFDDSFMKEVGRLEAYKNLLTYLQS